MNAANAGQGGAPPRAVSAPYGDQRSVLWYYLGILRRRIWVVLPVAVIFVTVGAIGAFRVPPIYRASARVLVERSAPETMRFDGGLNQGYQWDSEFFETQAQLVLSRAVLELALKKPAVAELYEAPSLPIEADAPSSWLHEIRRTVVSLLGSEPPQPPEPWEMLKGEVTVAHVPDTHFLSVESSGLDRQRVALLANAVADGFHAYHLQKRQETFSTAYTSLQKEKEKQEEKLLEAEKELQAFRERSDTVSMDASGADQPAIERLVKINQQLTEVQLQRIELASQLAVMKEAAAAPGDMTGKVQERLFALPVIQVNQRLVDSRRALSDAQREQAMLTETYGLEHPRMQAARAKTELVSQQFVTALTEVIDAHANRMKMIEEQEKELQKENDEQKKVALELARESFTLLRLKSEADRHRRLFDAIIERMREVDISSGLVLTSVQVVEHASTPKYPVNAGRGRKIIFALVMGTALGMGLAFLVENLDDTIKTPEDLRERLGVPLLGFVPAITREEAKAASGATVNIPESKDPRRREYQRRGAMILHEPSSSVAEAYRNIRTSLIYSLPADEAKLIAMTSCRPQEGKTTTSTNLALALSQTGKRVLLVDSDLHGPMTHRILGAGMEKGLSSILVGEEKWRDVVHTVGTQGGEELKNFHAISAGPSSPNPSELLGSRKMKEFLAEVRKEYDYIIIDTPPVLFVSDASVLAALADGVIFVVRAGATTRTLLVRAREQLEGVKAKIIGSVLNGMIVSKMGRYYSDYSYHGYSRYAKDYQRSYYKREGDMEEREN
ncbi:MAG: polysaccharide biosynthesis tyrosine autokinase [Lentisphaerae bacterium]|nr:polysaccharide biosynthesis tyrosine autokinase [Lentisphaerota bacterium]